MLSLSEVVIGDREAYLFFTVLFFDEVDLVDPEARGYLLQCSLCGEVGLLDPEARVYLVSLFVGVLIW